MTENNEPKKEQNVEQVQPVAPPPPPAATAIERIRDEYQPIEKELSPLSAAETLLRQPGRVVYELKNERSGKLAGLLLTVAAICLVAYGLTAGMFSWGIQLWAAPLKITLGMLFSALICLPSLVIFTCLSGSRTELKHICTLLVGMVALASLLLLGFAPVSWIFSQSTESVGFMGVLHILFYGVGIYYGLRFLFSAVRFLEGRRVQHLVVWSVIFVIVSLQMTTTLRPIIGESEKFLQKEKKFFLTHWNQTLWMPEESEED